MFSQQLNVESILKKLEIIKKTYSPFFSEFLSKMLNFEAVLRPNYEKALEMVKNGNYLQDNKKFFSPIKRKPQDSSRKQSKQKKGYKLEEFYNSDNKSFESVFLSPQLKKPLMRSESKSTKRTEKTTISFPSKEISYGSNRAVFERLREKEAKTPVKNETPNRTRKFYSLQKKGTPQTKTGRYLTQASGYSGRIKRKLTSPKSAKILNY